MASAAPTLSAGATHWRLREECCLISIPHDQHHSQGDWPTWTNASAPTSSACALALARTRALASSSSGPVAAMAAPRAWPAAALPCGVWRLSPTPTTCGMRQRGRLRPHSHRRSRCPGDLHRMEAVYGPQFRSVGSRCQPTSKTGPAPTPKVSHPSAWRSWGGRIKRLGGGLLLVRWREGLVPAGGP